MDVGLVNDGPVGVDFRCIDEAVKYTRLCNRPRGTNSFLGHYLDRLGSSCYGQPVWPATAEGWRNYCEGAHSQDFRATGVTTGIIYLNETNTWKTFSFGHKIYHLLHLW